MEELSLDELAEKYTAGTLTDAELEASGCDIDEVAEWAKNKMDLSLDELAEKYAAGTLTDAELEASGYAIHQVKGWVKTPTCAKILAALEKGIPDIHKDHYSQKIKICFLGRNMKLYNLNVWGDLIIIDTTRGGWSDDLKYLCSSITDKIMEKTGIKVFVKNDEEEFIDNGIINIHWEE